jgi:tetratricopeptide (TPR) repeat protein
MRFRKTLTFLTLAMVLVCVLPAFTQQTPLTQDQVQSLVRDGFGDDSGAKLIEQRGIKFAPAEDFMRSLKAAGASEAFLKALRTAKPSEPASAMKPINQVQVFALMAGGVAGHRVTMLVQERGIDFEPTNDYLQEVRLAGGEEELISALKSAKVTKPAIVDPAAQARQTEIRQHVARGAGLEKKGQYGAAEQEYRAALLLDSQNADLYLRLSNVLFGQQKWDDAESSAREALRLDPTDVAHASLGATLGKKGDRDGEIAEEREALRLNPNLAEAHLSLGVALGHKGDWDGQITEEHEALRLNPSFAEAHHSLGFALGRKGDWDGQITEEREALRLNPNYAEAHGGLGVALGQKGDRDGEITEEREALRLNPNDAIAHYNIGVCLASKDDWDGAIQEYREALGLNPNFVEAHAELGNALTWKGDWDGAIPEYREALRLNPNNAVAHFGLGSGLEQKGDLRGALDQYSAAHKLAPKDEDYKQNYERLLQQVNQ